jgi:cation diffusion facilitator CzcD-associated flavoprotein CzcO
VPVDIPDSPADDSASDRFDVLVIGAGLSGIAVARHLAASLPDASYAVLEAREAIGGTWDLFRYPGVRSDSDMFTLGYADKPWRGRSSMPPAEQILGYLREAATERGVERHIRLNHRVSAVSWSSAEGCWSVDVDRTDIGETQRLRCTWLFAAAGYYRYEAGFTPAFDGRERFRGRIVHPQLWPDDLDYARKRVVVIGSGSTAVTLVPALAGRAALVTMVQRTPTYVLPAAIEDKLAGRLSAVFGPDRGYAVTRRIRIGAQAAVWQFCRRWPRTSRRVIRRINLTQLPAGFDVDTHFNPPYQPWDQRLCIAPGGDLFRAIREGSAAVVTDRVTTFTERGILLASGRELEADIVVTATGLALQPFGGVSIIVDDVPVRLPEHVAYKGMMLSGVPNFAFGLGYPNASWTLKVDLVADHFCRLIRQVRDDGCSGCVPVLPEGGISTRPLIGLNSGYVRRSIGALPRQGETDPWRMTTRYRDDLRLLRDGPLIDTSLRMIGGAQPARQEVS